MQPQNQALHEQSPARASELGGAWRLRAAWLVDYSGFVAATGAAPAALAAIISAFFRRFRSFCLRSRLNLALSPIFPDIVYRFL
jgi:hypothetical protein